MKKSLLLITMLLLSAAWVVAQSTSPAPSASQPGASDSQATPASPSASSQSSVGSQTSAGDQAKASADANNTIRGCLSGSAGSYTLTDNASGKSYNLTGKTDDLSAHVGQEVEINGASASASTGGAMGSSASNPSGSASSNAGASSAAGAPSASGAGQAVASSFDVKSVTKIADTCSNK
jgi:hypothetical protein